MGDASKLLGYEAREHTYQIRGAVREAHDQCFRCAGLSVLNCSPTMELGVVITELNAVNKREHRTMLNPCEVGS